MTTPANLSEQTLALPKGAGEVSSAGQTFTASPFSGTGSYSVPIATKPGHAGLGPALALAYSTHGGNGIAGQGWSLGLAKVERRYDKGLPSYNNNTDTFTLQGDELLPVSAGMYRLRIENRFARVQHVRTSNTVDWWVVTERDGTRVFYGEDADHRLVDRLGRIAAWFPSRKQDVHGNEVTYSYTRDSESYDVRLDTVTWAGCYRVTFNYESRTDPITSARRGFLHTQSHRLASIEVEVKKTSDGSWFTYLTYDLAYTTSTRTGRSLLTSITLTGSAPGVSDRTLPSLTFGYTEGSIEARAWQTIVDEAPGGTLSEGDLTLVMQAGSGLPDILHTTKRGHWLRTNLGQGRFAPPKRVAAPGAVALSQQGVFISDMSADGWGDLVVAGGSRVYPGQPGGGWGQPYTARTKPNLDLERPDVRVLDLNGDGIPDALQMGPNGAVYYENQGKGKWSGPVKLFKPPPLDLRSPNAHLADISGDGFPDLIYVGKGRVQVWPGRGRGRFGEPYTMKNAPRFGGDFNPRYVRFADLSGSGQADLLYMARGRVTAYFNLAGHSFDDGVELGTAWLSSVGHLETTDLYGNGASGLLVTDSKGLGRKWRYLDVFPDGPADLLETIDNGLGAVTTLTYGSSAAHWARDKAAGEPWQTHLPSPQRVVDRVEVEDEITGLTLGTEYRYHHGVYDGREREFRGFGRVEQLDLEADDDEEEPIAQAMVRRWYHCGVQLDLSEEYHDIGETPLESTVPYDPWAFRALRGQLLREEVYAEDGETSPYVVRESGYEVYAIEKSPGTKRWAYAPLPKASRETLTERTSEARVKETGTTYDLDSGSGWGLPVEVREKGYGRTGTFTTDHELQQTEDLERYTTTTYHPAVNTADTTYTTPTYLVGFVATVEVYAEDAGGDVLLSREERYYDGTDYEGLGYPGSGTTAAVTYGKLSSRLVLALTDSLVSATYPSGSGAEDARDDYGAYLENGTDYFIHAERYKYDTTHGMMIGAKAPVGGETLFTYDSTYDLFPVEAVDPLDHPTTLTRGELPFQVATVVDANGNTTTFGYDATGLPAYKAVQGKYVSGAWQGDTTTYPTEAYAYDFSSTPIQVVTKTRQVRLGATFDVYRYIDGLGRNLQERHTAEDDPDTSATRYRVTGWQEYNHKGLVYRTYQPYFSSTSSWATGETTSAYVKTSYDPLGRPTRVDYPDGTFETTDYDPWVQTVADRNDNAGHLEADDARYGKVLKSFAEHLDTTTQTFFDALGREIAVAEDNGEAVRHEQSVRVRSYRIPSGAFTGTSYDLQLAGDLSADYFAMILGTVDTTGVDADNVGARITADPFATGDLTDSGAPDVLTLTRGASDEGDWEGVIVVWESLGDASHSGFSLVDVKSVTLSTHAAGSEQNGTETANTAWSDLDQVVLYGGLRGGGISATPATDSEFDTLAVKLVPSGTDTITASRWSVSGLQVATATVYVVQWGDEHTIQRVLITGNKGGDGIDADTEYETATITEVERSKTWLWMSGWTKSTGEGAGLLGLVPALGDGTQSSSETASSMGIGCEVSVDKSVCLVAHTHPDLQVDWQFRDDGDGDSSDTSVSYGTRYASRPETWDETSTPRITDGYRAALVFHSSEAITTNHEQVLWTARHTAAEDLDTERTSSGTEYAGWVQPVDLGAIEHLADEDQAIVSTTYELSLGEFTGTSYDLVLEHALAENYFVMLHGKVDVSGPDVDNVAVRVTADPFGTSDLSESGSDNVLTLTRLASDEGDWEGTIVVVECVADPDGAGFRLRDVKAFDLDAFTNTGNLQTETETANAKWKDLDQVALYGGLHGGGITPSAAASSSFYDTVAVRLEPSGDDTLTAERWAVSVLFAATLSVYVVEWGSEHTIQRVDVSGTAGGDGVNATSEYDTATITSVTRANTWVWGCGWAKDQGVGDGALTAAVTLGDGVNQNATESSVAVGSEYTDERSFVVTVHSHASLAVDHVFKSDGDLSSLSYDHTVDTASGDEAYETRTNPARTSGARFPVVTPTSNGTGTGFQYVHWSHRHTTSDTLTSSRVTSGQYWCAWVQSVDAAGVGRTWRRKHVTRSVLDLRDQVTEVYDARELGYASWAFTYDYAGQRIKTAHATAMGTRYALSDSAGNPIWSRDARGIEVDRTFDDLNRPLTESSTESSTTKLRRKWRYIEYDESDPDFSDYQDANLFGPPEEVRDADGLRFYEYDWRGLVTKASHRFWDVDWTNSSASVWTGGSSWDPEVDDTARASVSSWLTLTALDDTTTMEITTTYDAAGRPLVTTYPSFTPASTSMEFTTTRAYNAAGMLDSIVLNRGGSSSDETIIEDATYNARGQVTGFTHGNGVETTREYDSDLERLSRIFTQLVDTTTTHFQDLNYTYDPVGNPVAIRDGLIKNDYKANSIVPNTRTFGYDPRYRLVRATGRKHNTVVDGYDEVLVSSPDENDYEGYAFRYTYDEVGNFVRNDEYASGAHRHMNYKDGRIDLFNGPNAEATDPDPESGNWQYDDNGNTTKTPRHSELGYTFDSQPSYVDMGGGTEVRYLRHADQRVVRLVKKNGVYALGIYLGPFEYHDRQATTSYRKVVLHVEGHGRHAQVEEVVTGTDADSLDTFFVHGDHLGSGHILTKDDGTLLSQEEYCPYGRSSDRRDARNRYRFIGVERDEETGLAMTGPRTYSTLVGRFFQGDPVNAETQYSYSSASPARRIDASGYQDHNFQQDLSKAAEKSDSRAKILSTSGATTNSAINNMAASPKAGSPATLFGGDPQGEMSSALLDRAEEIEIDTAMKRFASDAGATVDGISSPSLVGTPSISEMRQAIENSGKPVEVLYLDEESDLKPLWPTRDRRNRWRFSTHRLDLSRSTRCC